MKHYFIINPKAGPIDTSNQLISEIKDVFAGLDYEIYVTKSVNDAYLHLSTIVKNLTVETCFYACGGDGTSYEVINAIMNHPLARFAVIPIGSCNDYLKSYPDYNFRNLKGYVNGKLLPIDILKANDYYAVNEVNIGYDARANYDCCRYKKKIKNIHTAYNLALAKNLLKMNRHTKIIVNNEVYLDQKTLLITAANGQYYGGGFKCTPYANPQDGMIDLMIVKAISAFKFLRMVKFYKRGEHVDHPKLKEKVVLYKQIKEVVISSNEQMCVCLDGENIFLKEIKITIIPQGIMMLFPKNDNV